MKQILVDNRNKDEMLPRMMELVSNPDCREIGFDIETFDEAHDGIVAQRKAMGGKSIIFDINRTTITGFSIYAGGTDEVFYVNLNHADVENRIPWEEVRPVLDSFNEEAVVLAHNAVFEIVMMMMSLGFKFKNEIICTLVMAVSTYSPDQYDPRVWMEERLGGIKNLFKTASLAFTADPSGKSKECQKVIGQVMAKQGRASHSYEGFMYEISYGYGLKKAVKSFFDYDMVEFKTVLNGKKHMGELTGDETMAYGCDDAYWCWRLFHQLIEMMTESSPNAFQPFLEQENPMIHVYAEAWMKGIRINHQAVLDKKDEERITYAELLRKFKLEMRKFLPFDEELNANLLDLETWYKDGKRDRLLKWLQSDNLDDDLEQCKQVSSPIGNAWVGKKCSDFTITHSHQVRLMFYDLMGLKPIVIKGKVQSNGECRGFLKQRIANFRKEGGHCEDWLDAAENAFDIFNEMQSLETRMKLYLNPYSNLIEPETGWIHPTMSSKLASRRMAMVNPNPMQLAKGGESTYVRGFYQADNDDHVLISIDWSQIELVIIGEASGDPEFAKAYGQLPYEDLHLGAAADVLGVSEDILMRADLLQPEEEELHPILVTNKLGEEIEKGKRRKFWRGEVGKTSNFEYWYSGALSNTSQKMGWTGDQMWDATDRYRKRFKTGEEWRMETIDYAKKHGFCELPDGLRRYKLECTYDYSAMFRQVAKSYKQPGLKEFLETILKKIKSRSNNQIVNSYVQGTCATLAKRSILRSIAMIEANGYDARFVIPVHDELVYSCHRSQAVAFIRDLKEVMRSHTDIIQNLKIDCTASIGRTFEPYHEKKAPFGQIELDEAPAILGFKEDSILNETEQQKVVDYLFGEAA